MRSYASKGYWNSLEEAKIDKKDLFDVDSIDIADIGEDG